MRRERWDREETSKPDKKGVVEEKSIEGGGRLFGFFFYLFFYCIWPFLLFFYRIWFFIANGTKKCLSTNPTYA
jgi:hypothetical protein